MTVAWVLGSNGLLGSALCRALARDNTDLFSPEARFRWNNELELETQIDATVQAFSARLVQAQRWEIYWAAGNSTMSSIASDLAFETRTLARLLRKIESEPRLAARLGGIAFASSAGAIYAGSSESIINERTVPAPTTCYAKEKLTQEDLLRSFASRNKHTSVLLARLSTLYGAGQSPGKQQGLIAHIARCILRNKPVQIYVPYDTIRDYISSHDAAYSMIATVRTTNEAPQVLTRIIASEQPTTVAEIIAIFKRITRRVPRIITSTSRMTAAYPRRMRFQSTEPRPDGAGHRTSLLVGIAQLMAEERMALVRRHHSHLESMRLC